MQQNPELNPDQNPQVNPSNQTFINTVPVAGNTPQGSTTQKSAEKSESIVKIVQLIWFVIGFINVVLALRIIFLLFNARSSGFTGFLYNVTAPFVMPFNGIFPVPGQSGYYFDTAALVAIIIYSLATWGIATLIGIISNNEKSA